MSFWRDSLTWHALGATLRMMGFTDLLDILIVSVLIYFGLRAMTQARVARVAQGVAILVGLYIFARETGMVLTTIVFRRFLTVLLLALVVIFQEELRRFFERLSFWPWPSDITTPEEQTVEPIAQAAMTFALGKIGAIIVVRGRDPLERHLDGGHRLGGEVCRPLLESLFDPHSDGHDGAVIIEKNRVTHFGVHLPLSKRVDQLEGRGTRHAAALGLSEVSDALCVVISEQKGTISIARNGQLTGVANSRKGLETQLFEFMEQKALSPVRRAWWTLLARHAGLKGLSAIAGLGLWLVFVQGFQPEEQTYRVPIRVHNVGDRLEIESITPDNVTVKVSGLARDFERRHSATPRISLDVGDAEAGNTSTTITDDDIDLPETLHVVSIEPTTVSVTLTRPVTSTGALRGPSGGSTSGPSRRVRTWFSAG